MGEGRGRGHTTAGGRGRRKTSKHKTHTKHMHKYTPTAERYRTGEAKRMKKKAVERIGAHSGSVGMRGGGKQGW